MLDLPQWFVIFDKKKLPVEQVKITLRLIQNQQKNNANQLLENLRKKYTFLDNIWGADLTDKHLLSKFNKGFRFLLCVMDIYSKDAWVISLKDKKILQLPIFFKKIETYTNL